METFSHNPYYSPDKCKLKTVADLEMSEPNYDFDYLVVWRHIPSNKLYWAHDSGCSCPVPFEDFMNLSMFNELSSDNYDELKRFASSSYDAAARAAFLRKVRNALAK